MAPPSALHRAGRVLRPCLLACIAAAPASAFDLTSKHPEHGFSIGLPAAFEARPVPPGSEGLLLVHAPKDAPKDRRAPVTHQVFTVEDAATAEDVQRWVLRTFQPSELARERSVRKRYGRTPARFTGAYLDGAGETRAHAFPVCPLRSCPRGKLAPWSQHPDVLIALGVDDMPEERAQKAADS